MLRLARVLYLFAYGHRTDVLAEWDNAETRENYLADAEDMLRAHPHLLPANLRTDMLV